MTVLHFVSGTVLTVNARNYFRNLLFANYYTAVYSVVTATNFTWYTSICRNPPTLSGLCAFQTLTNPVKISQIQPRVSQKPLVFLVCRKRDIVVDVGPVSTRSTCSSQLHLGIHRLSARSADPGTAAWTTRTAGSARTSRTCRTAGTTLLCSHVPPREGDSKQTCDSSVSPPVCRPVPD